MKNNDTIYSSSGHEASVNRNNAARQLGVNAIANHIGSGSGTASYDGVPGTVLGVTGHDRYSYGHGQAYGHGGYGNNNFGGHGFHNGGYGGFGGFGGHHGFGHGRAFGGYGAY